MVDSDNSGHEVVDLTGRIDAKRRLRNPDLASTMDTVDELFMHPEHTAGLNQFALFALGELQRQVGRRPIKLDHLVAASDGRLVYAEVLDETAESVRLFFAFGAMNRAVVPMSATMIFPRSFFPMQERSGANQWITFEQMSAVDDRLEEAMSGGLDVAAYSQVVERLGGAFGYDQDGYYITTPDGEVQRLVTINDSINRNRRRVAALAADSADET